MARGSKAWEAGTGGGEGAENTAAAVAEGGGQGAFFCSLAGVVFGEPITTMGLVGASRRHGWCANVCSCLLSPTRMLRGGAGGMCVGQDGSHPTVVFSCLVCFLSRACMYLCIYRPLYGWFSFIILISFKEPCRD